MWEPWITPGSMLICPFEMLVTSSLHICMNMHDRKIIYSSFHNGWLLIHVRIKVNTCYKNWPQEREIPWYCPLNTIVASHACHGGTNNWHPVQQLIQTNSKEIIKALYPWHCLQGQCPGRANSPHNGLFDRMWKAFLYHDVTVNGILSRNQHLTIYNPTNVQAMFTNFRYFSTSVKMG